MVRSFALYIVFALPACGGVVRFEPGDGGGGSDTGGGGNGGTSTNTSVNQSSNQNATVNQSSSVNQSVSSTNSAVSTTTGPVSDCETACTTLYKCGLEDGNCSGFSGTSSEEMQFVAGCVQGCQDQPVLIQLIDGNNCDNTIATIKGVSAEFASICDFGF